MEIHLKTVFIFTLFSSGCVLIILLFTRPVKTVFDTYYGSGFYFPKYLIDRTQKIIEQSFRIWFVYFCTITLMSVTVITVYYFIPILSNYPQIINSDIPIDTITTIFLDNSPTFQIVVYGGILYSVLFAILARIYTLSYTDSFIKILVSNAIVMCCVLLLSAPIILQSPIKNALYDGISDITMSNYIVSDYLFWIFICSLLTTAITESFLVFNRKLSLLHTGNYEVVHRDIINHEIGERAVSNSAVVDLYCGVIERVINGDDFSLGEGLQDIKWCTFGYHEKIWKTMLVEIHTHYLCKTFDLNIETVRAYFNYKFKRNYIPSYRIEFSRLTAAYENYICSECGMTPNDLDIIKREVDRCIKQKIKIIREDPGDLGTNNNNFATMLKAPVGSRRFMIINGHALIISCPVPYRTDLNVISNTAIYLADNYYRVEEYENFFNDRFNRLTRVSNN